MEYPANAEVYTIMEAAVALGRTLQTVKRWIADDLIPAPVLTDTTHNYRQYSVGELRIIAEELAEHESSFTYYGVAHTHVREQIAQRVHGFRANSI